MKSCRLLLFIIFTYGVDPPVSSGTPPNYINVVGSSVQYSKPTFGLTILNAVWGAPPSFTNITSLVRTFITNNAINVIASAGVNPPNPTNINYLSVDFIYNGVTYSNFWVQDFDFFIVPFATAPATPLMFSGSGIQLSWDANTLNTNYAYGTAYAAYRSTSASFYPGNSFPPNHTNIVFLNDNLSAVAYPPTVLWFDSGLVHGTTYYYYIVSQVGGVSSPLSSQVITTP